jgi:hypothetical protein
MTKRDRPTSPPNATSSSRLSRFCRPQFPTRHLPPSGSLRPSPIMAAKRKHAAMGELEEEPLDPSDELMFFCLGGGNEVGRSSHIIQYKGKTVMVSFPARCEERFC